MTEPLALIRVVTASPVSASRRYIFIYVYDGAVGSDQSRDNNRTHSRDQPGSGP